MLQDSKDSSSVHGLSAFLTFVTKAEDIWSVYIKTLGSLVSSPLGAIVDAC